VVLDQPVAKVHDLDEVHLLAARRDTGILLEQAASVREETRTMTLTDCRRSTHDQLDE